MHLNKLIVLLYLAVPCFAAKTTVTDTIVNGNGTVINGTLYITPVQQFTSGGTNVYPTPVTVNVTRGLFTVDLYPNDTAVPTGTYYIVRYTLKGSPSGSATTEFWTVPAGGSVGLSSVRSVTAPSTSFAISPTQISAGGATAGKFFYYTGSSWAPSHGITSSTNSLITGLSLSAGASQSTNNLLLAQALATYQSGIGADTDMWVGTTTARKIVMHATGMFLTSDMFLQWKTVTGIDAGGTFDNCVGRSAGGEGLYIHHCNGVYAGLKLKDIFIAATSSNDMALENSQCTLFLSTNTVMKARCRGSDGVMREVSLTLAP